MKRRLFLFLYLIFILLITSCASVFKTPSPMTKGEMMFVDEDKDVDFLKAEETATEGGSHSGCPT